EISVQRLLKRGENSGRLDDNDTVIRQRLKEYDEKTLPVLEFYKSKGVFFEVSGAQDVETVTQQIDKVVEDLLSKRLYNILLFGYPGSGRGYHGQALVEKYGFEYIATGAILEKEILNDTIVGRHIRKAYEAGEHVPDDIVVDIIEKKLDSIKNARGFIFKGFPRTLVQSYILDGLLQKHDTNISKIIELEVPPLDLILRLSERGDQGKQLPYDSSVHQIVRRLKEHESKTVPVINKYKQTKGVTTIDGLGAFEEVFERICAEVETGLKSYR
ncbi:MAG: nucleoside monophosphate kinase, partial [Ignavibacteriales bacterium]|nr:nucleoside monophosphate kinase [Ignavibacteriales bacterium]